MSFYDIFDRVDNIKAFAVNLEVMEGRLDFSWSYIPLGNALLWKSHILNASLQMWPYGMHNSDMALQRYTL